MGFLGFFPRDIRTNEKSYPHGYGSLVRLVLRFLQFVFALTVAGLYGVDLHAAHQAHAYTDGRWVFAEVCAGLSAVSVFVYLTHLRWLVFWDAFLFILWTTLFGIFGKIYIPAHPTPRQTGQIRMKHAVWIDLINMLLWFITLISGLVVMWMEKPRKTQSAGRAPV